MNLVEYLEEQAKELQKAWTLKKSGIIRVAFDLNDYEPSIEVNAIGWRTLRRKSDPVVLAAHGKPDIDADTFLEGCIKSHNLYLWNHKWTGAGWQLVLRLIDIGNKLKTWWELDRTAFQELQKAHYTLL